MAYSTEDDKAGAAVSRQVHRQAGRDNDKADAATYNADREWRRWAVTQDGKQTSPFLRWLKSVIPPDAHTPNPALAKSPGKVVGHKNANGTWGGNLKWTSKHMTLAEAKRAARDGASIGLQGVNYPAIDGDIDNPQLAERVKTLAFEIFGQGSPVRGKAGSSRFLIMLQLAEGEAPFEKRRLKFADPTTGEQGAIELLAAKQMYVVAGLHKSGALLEWDRHPCDPETHIPRVTKTQVDAFFRALADYLMMMGYVFVSSATNGGGSGAAVPRKSLDDPSLWAPSPQHVLDLLKVWPNTPENVPMHDDFVRATAMIKASFGPDREDYYPDFEQWALEYPGNNEEYVRARWESIT